MSDSTSAEVFGEIYTSLASMPQTDEIRSVAKMIWHETRWLDYSGHDLYADEALTMLGLAKRGVDADFPEDGERTLYYKEDFHE